MIPSGATNVTRYYVLRDSTTHAPKNDIDITDVDAYFVTYLGAVSTKYDLSALASATASHVPGAGFNIGHGLYRVDWPETAFEGSPGETVQLFLECTGVDATYEEVWLSTPYVLPELTGDPGATPLLTEALMLLYMALRNNTIATSNSRAIRNDAGTTVLTATMSDDGTTFNQGKLVIP